MKIDKILKYTLIVSCTFCFSCEKWIDVAPKTQIENTRFFTNKQAFQEALNGVYIKMGSTALYGTEMTFGLVDVLGGMYSLSPNNGSIAYRNAFNSSNYAAEIEPVVISIWTEQYNAIANINNLLEQLDRVGTDFLSNEESLMLRGEALGLRAFLHFDLLRLYAPSMAQGGGAAQGIPYVTAYTGSSFPRQTVEVVLKNLKEDLNKAEQFLENDPIKTNTSQEPDRKLHFNYYAVKALKARVYLWEGDQVSALEEAEDVINAAEQRFAFIDPSQISSSLESARNRVFTTEHIFGLYVTRLAVNNSQLLEPTITSITSLMIDQERREEQYETASVGATDYRSNYLLRRYVPRVGTINYYYGKLYQPTDIPSAYANRMPLIKIPEMYYIAAECLRASDPHKAVEYLNIVRRSRGILTDLQSSISENTIQREIRKEYWKEQTCEGQFFFYLKRTNAADIPGLSVASFSSKHYILPLPQLELEFGS